MNKPAVGWPDVDHARTPLGWVRPSNLMPPVAAGWSPGTRRNASEAESILSEAVAWWDPTVSGFRDGDRWLRNSGTAGGLLDLRLGSSVVANTNDPKWLGPEDRGYAYLPGVAGNYLSVPDENALDLTGDLDLRGQIRPATWTPPGPDGVVVVGKLGSGARYSYWFNLLSNGKLRIATSPNGSTIVNNDSTVATGFSNNEVKWVRATLDLDDGAGNRVAKFYTSDDGVSWTQLGDTVTTAGTASIYVGTALVEVGSYWQGTAGTSPAAHYRAQVLNGIDGTTVLDIDCDAITSGSATSFTATTGQTVTINRSTSGRKSVAVPARRLGGRACFLFGTDDYMEVVDNWQHQLLNFGQGDSFTALAVARHWSAIGSLGATQITKGGGQATQARWSVFSAPSTNNVAGFINDGATSYTASAVSFTYGAMNILGTSCDRSANALTTFVNATRSTALTVVGARDVRNNLLFRVARTYGDLYADMEFRGAAIWRRPLTAREISVLSTYYSGG